MGNVKKPDTKNNGPSKSIRSKKLSQEPSYGALPDIPDLLNEENKIPKNSQSDDENYVDISKLDTNKTNQYDVIPHELLNPKKTNQYDVIPHELLKSNEANQYDVIPHELLKSNEANQYDVVPANLFDKKPVPEETATTNAPSTPAGDPSPNEEVPVEAPTTPATKNDASPFKGYAPVGQKVGGANQGKEGGKDGVYTNGQETALIKQDFKDGELRAQKVIAEFICGQLLTQLYIQLDDNTNGTAFVDLIQPTEFRKGADRKKDLRGENTYLKSTFIPGYVNDLWKIAHQEDYKKKLDLAFNKIKDPNKKIAFIQNEYKKFRKFIRKLDTVKDKDLIQKLESPINIENKNEHFENLAQLHLLKMGSKKPGTAFEHAFGRESTAITAPSNFIIQHGLQREFANIAARRLLFGDYGIHAGNIGVTKDENGKYHLCSIDFGSSFNPDQFLSGTFNPNDLMKNLTRFYKNFFLDYTEALRKSPEMAAAFIQLDEIKRDEFRKMLEGPIKNMIAHYGLGDALKKFCKQVGFDLKKISLDDVHNEDDYKNIVAEKLIDHLAEKLEARKKLLVNFGKQLQENIQKQKKPDNAKATKVTPQPTTHIIPIVITGALSQFELSTNNPKSETYHVKSEVNPNASSKSLEIWAGLFSTHQASLLQFQAEAMKIAEKYKNQPYITLEIPDPNGKNKALCDAIVLAFAHLYKQEASQNLLVPDLYIRIKDANNPQANKEPPYQFISKMAAVKEHYKAFAKAIEAKSETLVTVTGPGTTSNSKK